MSRSLRVWNSVALLTAVGIAAVSLSPARAGEPAKGPPGKEAVKLPPSGIKVSRETTFITGPLRKDGMVDYQAALNLRYSQGVTPENNAVVLLLQAIGPREISKPYRERFFRMLGIAPLPEKGAYIEPFEEYFKRKSPEAPKDEKAWINPWGAAWDQVSKRYAQIDGRPWSKEEFPIEASWLEENQKQIDLIVAATKRPRYYHPLLSGSEGQGVLLLVALLELPQECRKAGRTLIARAMYRIGSGKSEQALQDLLACHRLARLVSQGPTPIEGLVAIEIEGMAIQGDALLAHEGKLTAEQAQRFAADLRKLAPMGKMIDRINWCERFTYLDAVCYVARRGLTEVNKFDGWSLGGNPTFDRVVNRAGKVLIDWNEPMRMGNQWYDRFVAALSKPSRKERDAAVAEFERDLKKLAAEAEDPRVLLRNIMSAGSVRGGLGRQIGHVLIAALMIPRLANVENQAVTSQGMVQVVFALAAYRAKHGSYPADLAALVPKYLAAIPEDLFSGGPLRYKRQDAGYVVYSVGLNRKDDGGRSSSDDPDDEVAGDCDDIAIRVPAKKK